MRMLIAGLASLALASIAAAPAAGARAPIKDCGDISTLDHGGFFLGAITAQRGACVNARAVARKVGASAGCKARGSCSVNGYRCALAKVGKELTLVRCENSAQTAFIRFEFGS